MKKAIVPMLSLLAVTAVGSLFSKPISAKAAANVNGWDYDSYNPTDHAADSPFEGCWGNTNTRSMRLTEQAAMFADVPAFGTRGTHKSLFDLSTFEFTVELSHRSNLVLLTFTKTPGGYFSEGNMIANIDIVPARSNKIDGITNQYIVCLSASVNSHNISIEGFNDGTDWADDNNFKGVAVTAADNKIHMKFNRVSSENTEVTVNDRVFTVSNSILYQQLENSGLAYNTPSHVVVGGMNGSGFEKIIFEQFTDSKHTEYYSATGAFGFTKTALSELKDASIVNSNEAEVFIAKYKTLKYDELESYDKEWLKNDYQIVQEKYATARSLSPTYMLEQRVNDLKEACKVIETKEDISEVESAIKAVQAAYEEIDASTLSESGKAVYDNSQVEINNAKAKISTVAVKIYKETVATYVKAVAAIKDVETLLKAKDALVAIPVSYSEYFTSEEEFNEQVALINKAKEDFAKKTRSDSKNITQGNYADILTNDDGSLIVSTDASSQYGDKVNSSGVYFEQPVAYSNFSVTFNVQELNSDNTWIALGIMEQPDMFIIADNDSVTNNKGVSFRMQRTSLSTITVEIYVTSMTATRYYDAKLLTTMNIPYQQDVTLKMKNVTKNLGGILDNYYTISFNDNELNETIKVSKMKTVFPNGDNAYLFFGSYCESRIAYTIKNINGKKPLSDDLKPASSVPTSNDTAIEYEIGSGNDLSMNLDTKGEMISSVKIGKKVVSSANYTYENNVLTIKASALSKLEEGEQKVVVETAYGSVSWTLTVKTAGSSPVDPEPETPTNNNGCGGSIIATSAIASTLALAGIGLVIYKKKETK